MSVPVHATDYFKAARERMTQATLLRRSRHYALAMYVAGVAAECMLRAYHRAGSNFDERHNIADLFKACDPDKLGDAAKNRLRGPIQTIHLLWQNRYRFFSQDRLRCHLKALGPPRRDAKRGDFLKEKCVDLENACLTVVTIGVQRWQ